jgi:hypothetical protein
MDCSVNLFDILQNEDAQGVLTFLYYDADEDGIEDSGGSVIIVAGDGSVNFNNAIPGDYYFSHITGEGDCESEVIFFVRVLERPDAGTGATIDLCNTAAAVNIFSLISGTPDLNGVFSGSGVASNGYDDNNTSDPLDDTFDPTQVSIGVYQFIYTVEGVAPNGFVLSDCENCGPQSTTITINVIDCTEPPPPCDAGDSASLQVCASSGCTFDLFNYLAGTPDSGGQWTLLPGAPSQIIPIGSEGTVNFNNAANGTYQYQYDLQNNDPNCNDIAIITVQVTTPNAGNNFALQLCDSMPATNLFPFLGNGAQSGGTWTITPGLPAGTFVNGVINPAPGDAGVYVVTYTVTTNQNNNPCGPIVCSDSATGTLTISATCNAGNNVTTPLCDNVIYTLNAITQLGASTNTGSYLVFGQSANCNNVYSSAIFSVNGGPAINQQGNTIEPGDTVSNFQNVGCILLIYTCGAGGLCNDQSNHILHITDCAPSCTAEVTISAVACALSSLITGTCPSPVYQWQIFQGGNWIAAPIPNNASTYTGLHNQQYRLRVTNCTGCGTLFSNSITVSCPPVPICNISCVLTYNVGLQRLEGVITNSGAVGGTMAYQFNRYTNVTPLCTNCTGVQAATCSGNVVIPALGNVQLNCIVNQTSIEQCFRLVLTGGACNSTLCCVKIPAAAALNCYELPTLLEFTDIVSLTVGGTNIINNAQFGCDEYESTQPLGTMNGNINCGLPQLAIDINQWLAANGHSGSASVRQSGKSSTLRIKDTNVIFNSIGSVTYGTISFLQLPSGCTLCDPNSWHFQGCNSVTNFPSILYLNPDVAGSLNLFTMLDLYVEEIPHTGTFTAAVCGSVTSGCIDINTNCCAGGPSPVTVHPTSGLLSWTPFNVPQENGRCFWHIRYLVTLPNGCAECIHITVNFDENI